MKVRVPRQTAQRLADGLFMLLVWLAIVAGAEWILEMLFGGKQ